MVVTRADTIVIEELLFEEKGWHVFFHILIHLGNLNVVQKVLNRF